MSFSKIKIETIGELKEIITRAKQIRSITPFSFRILVQKLEIFKPRSKRLKELYTKYNTEEMIAFPIISSELINIMYNDLIKCPDSQSQKNHNYFIPGSTFVMNQEDECYYCNLKETPYKQYIVIDLRILKSNEESFNEGTLPIKTFFTRENLLQKDLNMDALIYEKLEEHKGKAHIILITNDTLYFPRYEQKFYSNKGNLNSFLLTFFGRSQKVEREINEKELQNLVKDKAKIKKRYKLKEYENIKKIIAFLQDKEYPHVSYVFGGYREVHELAMKYSISIKDHNTEKCEFCIKNKAKNEQIDLFYKLYGNKNQQINKTFNITSPQSNKNMSLSSNEDRKNSIEILNIIKLEDEEESNSEHDRYSQTVDYIDVDKMNDYIKDTLHTIFHSLLLKHNTYSYKDKVILIFNFDTMRVFKMFVDISQPNDSKINFGMLDLIKTHNIKCYSRDNNIFKVEYNWIKSSKDEDTQQKESLTLDLFTDIDGDNFANELDEIISMYQRTSSKDSS